MKNIFLFSLCCSLNHSVAHNLAPCVENLKGDVVGRYMCKIITFLVWYTLNGLVWHVLNRMLNIKYEDIKTVLIKNLYLHYGLLGSVLLPILIKNIQKIRYWDERKTYFPECKYQHEVIHWKKVRTRFCCGDILWCSWIIDDQDNLPCHYYKK